MRSRGTRASFTLVELLTVIALVAVLSAIAIPALNREDQMAAIRSAEANIANLIVMARTTAILKRAEARLVICTDSSRGDAHCGQIAVAYENAAGEWQLASEPYRLPLSVRVVPSSEIPVASGVTWPAAVKSSFSGSATSAVHGLDCGSYAYVKFTATGRLFAGPELMISPARKTASGFEFFMPTQVRSFLFRTTGHYVLLKDASSL